MSKLVLTVKDIAIFVAICEMMIQITPGKNYEKYIKPMIGFMVLCKMVKAVETIGFF